MFTDDWLDKINDLSTGQTVTVSNLKIGAFTADTGLQTNAPTAEAAYTNYARQTGSFAEDNTNDTAVMFPITDVEYIATHIALIADVNDGTTTETGKIISYAALDTPKTVASGNPLVFEVGSINMNVAVSTCP